MSRLSQRIFKHNKILSSITMFLLPYDWAYKKGFVDGMEKSNYIKGYSDGTKDATEVTVNSFKKFFNKPELRNNGKQT